ncbi:hypothetical protein BDN70DRAFT_881825 [Pholiota conissans]|uniref:Protein-S-isoprenylcysteine O-methyltransferase n=1 Tax=Pholiota conissans TaxID=109636 RepID=A0A9P6CXV0_9AGAR|nr:hypothetical protein BDN70DRAFT_881825 [Pholiota conissans]
MSLAKIPLAILFALAFKRTITPPNPPASDKEMFVKGGLNKSWYLVHVPVWAPRLQYLASLAETVTILALHYPNHPYSKVIISALTFRGGNVASLDLSPINLLGGLMMITGSLIRLATYRHLGKFFRFEASIQQDHQLVTGGPYSVVRHPSYTGLLLTHTGWFLWQFGAGSWVRSSGLLNTIPGKAVVSTFAGLVILGTLYLTLGRMGAEDKALQKTFGKQWDEWASHVRYMVIPGIW